MSKGRVIIHSSFRSVIYQSYQNCDNLFCAWMLSFINLYGGVRMISRFSFISTRFLIVALVAVVTAFSWTTIASASGAFISSENNNRVLEFEPDDGEFFRTFAEGDPLDVPLGLLFDNNGDVYVSSCDNSSVLYYDGGFGGLISIIIPSGSGGLECPSSLLFAPNRTILVASLVSDEVLRYDRDSGDFIDVFVSAGSGGLNAPRDMKFGPNGNLYVVSEGTNEIIEYNRNTGDFVRVLVTSGSGGLDGATALFFIPGNLLVASSNTDEILSYNPSTGDFQGAFVSAGSGGLDNPQCIDFGFEAGANMFVCSFDTDEILQYSRFDGSFLGTFVPSGDGSLDGPVYIAFKDKTGENNGSSSCSITAAGADNNSAIAFILLFIPIAFVAIRRIVRA